jgi:hypothetical protein
MDAFENVIASILQRRGYWTMTGVKVELTKAEKRAIGRHSAPRWELDIVAHRGKGNELLVMECKSFLDSPGVEVGAFNGKKPHAAGRYKLFSDAKLRRVVLNRLTKQLVDAGFCRRAPAVRLGLAAGRINGDEDWLRDHFERRGWRLWGPSFIREELRTLRDTGYENSVAAVVAKVLLREPKGRKVRSGVDAAV